MRGIVNHAMTLYDLDDITTVNHIPNNVTLNVNS